MDMMVKDGDFVPGAGGLPVTVTGLQELLNCVRLSLMVRQGKFPYDRSIGSRLHLLDRQEEHAAERAAAMASEALMWLPGVRVTEAVLRSGGGIIFAVETPLGEGEVRFGEL